MHYTVLGEQHAPPGSAPPNTMKRILALLRNTDRPLAGYVWRAALVAFIPSVLLSAVVTSLFPSGTPDFEGPVLVLALTFVVVSPWLETLLMWPILTVLQRFSRNTLTVAAASALVWGLLHSLAAPAWGLVVVWPFFVFSICFLEWRKRSRGMAIVATALVHTGQNLLPALALLAGGGS